MEGNGQDTTSEINIPFSTATEREMKESSSLYKSGVKSLGRIWSPFGCS